MPEEIFETPQTTPPVEPKSTDWTKIILVAVLGLGLLAGSAYAGYYYGTESANLKNQISKPQLKTQIPEAPTPKPTTPPVEDETRDWRVYTDTMGGYSIKYPSDWQASKIEGGSAPTDEDSRVVFGVTPGLIGIVVKTDYCGEASLEQCVLGEWSPQIQQVLETEKLTLYGEIGVKVTPTSFDNLEYGLGGSAMFVTAQHDKKIYKLWISVKKHAPVELPTEEEFETFDQILSTFKFLE